MQKGIDQKIGLDNATPTPKRKGPVGGGLSVLQKIVLATALTACGGANDKKDDGESPSVIDNDGDGYTEAEDCDDSSAQVNPSAEEACDGVDNNCDKQVDEGVTQTYYLDNDGDGYGAGSSTVACEPPTSGTWVITDNDCDDTNPNAFPGADEVCDGVDNDCDGDADGDAINRQTWYQDSDGDYYGNPEASQLACEAPDGYVSNDGDCADTWFTINPSADEVCNGLDDDCDGDADTDAIDRPIWFRDSDGDGYGDPGAAKLACEQPDGYIVDDTDCDDDDKDVHPGILQDEDHYTDSNCDGSTDEEDKDGDGCIAYWDCDDRTTTRSCSLVPGIHTETEFGGDDGCTDGVDNNCDGFVDCEDGSCATDAACTAS